jgi:hypothetical protein
MDQLPNAEIAPAEPIPLDLICDHYRGEKYPFRLRLHFDALAQLMNDALHSIRVYELMMIKRPGDVWNYVWVEAVEMPPRIAERMREHASWLRKNFITFGKFDGMFRYAYDDTEPEDACWLKARGDRPFAELADQLFTQVKVIQARVRKSPDLLTKHVLTAMEAGRHRNDYLQEPPIYCTLPGYKPVYPPTHSEIYYRKLEELLSSPEITSVGFSYETDFEAIRLACTEQRRRADATGAKPRDAFHITALADGLHYARDWEADILRYIEGLGWAQLYVSTPETMKICVKIRGSAYPFFFLDTDAGEVSGYTKITGHSWFLYSATTEQSGRQNTQF